MIADVSEQEVLLTLPAELANYAGYSFAPTSTESFGGYGDPTSGTYDLGTK